MGRNEIGRGRTAAAMALLGAAALLMTACESATVERVNATRADASIAALTTSEHLTTAARAHSQAMCAAGAVAGSPDPTSTYSGEPATAVDELVGRAPLDAGIADWGSRNAAAAGAIWATWQDDPRLVDPAWQSVGVGEVECADGNLYSTLVLRDDIGAIGDVADTSRIQLVSSVNQGGWHYDFYRNLAYGCSISGYQTFLIGTKIGSSPTATRPLWVKMHGGGVGYFDAGGAPRPATHKTEESRASLLTNVDSGLMTDIMGAPEGFRTVVVSMCSHDAYAGADTTDPGNPNTLPDGSPRTTNGLYATKAAIQFAEATYPTDDLFLQGGSAGSAGSFHVAWGLQEQGLAPAGIVADSGIVNRSWEQAQIDQGLPCAMIADAAARVPARWHPDVADPANQPDQLVLDGRLTVPIMQVWDKGDHNVCGTAPMQCPLPNGSVVTMAQAECVREPMRQAIVAQGPASRSANLAVCVDDPSLPDICDRHVVLGGAGLLNTDPGAPADFQAFVYQWVHLRLADD